MTSSTRTGLGPSIARLQTFHTCHNLVVTEMAIPMSNRRTTAITAIAGLALFLQAPLVAAKSPVEVQADEMVAGQGEIQSITPERRGRFNYGTYILGPGDIIQIELLDIPELSGVFSIGPDGTIFFLAYVLFT